MKKIFAIILTLAIIAVSIPMTYVFAIGEKAEYSVTANKTTVVAGDEIEFSVKLDLINKMTAFEFTLDIPSGLTLVPGSQTAIARDVLGFDNVNNNESALLVSGYGSNPYTATGTLTLATFKCTVDSNAVGKYTVGLKDTVLNDDEYEEEAHDVTSVEINVVIPATGISIKETISLTEGNTEQLTATLTPANATDTVSWTSNNESVATVSSTGLVTAVKKGTAIITATAGNVSDTCAVTVNCAHANTTPHTAVSSTCKVQGHGTYTTCDDCGEVISGSDAKLPLADHTYGEWIPEVSATHDANGVKGHYHCSVCEKNFDSSKNEISSLVITKDANHGTPDSAWKTDATYHWHECKVVGCGVVIESTKAKHTFEWKTDKPATEDETGLKHEECSVCGLKRNENTPISKLDHTHTGITYHAAIAATCKSTGNIEYWTCSSSKCAGKYYSDNLCQNEITTGITTSIDSSNHVGGTEYRNQKAATCYEEGYEGDIYCLGCGAKIGTGKSITKLSHTPGNWKTDATYHWKECTVVACGVVIDSTKAEHNFEWKVDTAATEDAAGVKHEECSVCGYKRNENTTIPKLDHTHTGITHHEAKPGSCKAEGNIEYWTCSSPKCAGKYYSEETCTVTVENITVPVDENNHLHTEIRGKKDATCTEDGYTGDTYCTDCGKKLEDGQVIKATGHTYENGKCKVCGTKDPNYTPTSPQTGDNSHMTLWIILASVSSLAVFALTLTKKKRTVR